MKAWPIDPLAFRDVKLEVSEKFKLVVDFESQVPKTMASWRVAACEAKFTKRCYSLATLSNCGEFLKLYQPS